MKHIITSIFMTIAIMTAAVAITLAFKGMYYVDAESMNLAEKTGYSYEEICANYDELVAYNQDVRKADLNLTVPMSEEGKMHFADVKYLFVAIQYVLLPIGLLGAFFGIRSIKKEKEQKYDFLRWTCIFSVSIPAVLICFVFAAWDLVFELFHKIFFRNDLYVFNPATDPIIDMLPSTFFMHCAVVILLLTLAGGGICYLLYRRYSQAAVKFKPIAPTGTGATPAFKKKK